MDPITAAIVGALTAGAVDGATKAGEQAIPDAYSALKVLLKRKFSKKKSLTEAIDSLESKPTSKGRCETLKEEVAEAEADKDQEALNSANLLLRLIESKAEEKQSVSQTVVGDKNVFSGTGDVTVER